MRIFSIKAENIQSLRVVEIKPRRGVTIIAGANGSGKTTLLSAPSWALGGKGEIALVPVRDGEASGSITLTIGGDAVEFIVTRTIAADGKTNLLVTAPNGSEFRRPQELLAKWVGALTFDPFAFDRMAPKDQVAELQKIAPISGDVGLWRSEIRVAFDERTAINRRAKELAAKLAGLPPIEKLDAGGTLAEWLERLKDAHAHNAGCDRRSADNIAQNAKIDELSRRAVALRAEAAAIEAEVEKLTEAINAAPAIGFKQDTTKIEAALEIARRAEAADGERERRAELEKERDQAEAQSKALTAKIEEKTAQIESAIAAARMPVPGLAYSDDGILLNGLPFAQASTAERLRVSVGIGMAANPTLRNLFVREWSLLDDDSRSLVEALAAEHGFDIWAEVVGDSPVGFVLKEGEVVKVDGVSADA